MSPLTFRSSSLALLAAARRAICRTRLFESEKRRQHWSKRSVSWTECGGRQWCLDDCSVPAFPMYISSTSHTSHFLCKYKLSLRYPSTPSHISAHIPPTAVTSSSPTLCLYTLHPHIPPQEPLKCPSPSPHTLPSLDTSYTPRFPVSFCTS